MNLRTLDLSFNRIAKIEGLEELVNLTSLFLVHNKIGKVEGLDSVGIFDGYCHQSQF